MKMDFQLNPKSSRFIAVSIAALLVAPVVASARHHYLKKHHSKSEHASKRGKNAAADSAIKPVVGTWYVNQHGKESHAQKLVLRPNGTFAFVGAGWKSEGNYSVKEGSLKLEWTAVDGEKVEPGQMHKDIALNSGMNSFVIDQYTYGKHAEVAEQ